MMKQNILSALAALLILALVACAPAETEPEALQLEAAGPALATVERPEATDVVVTVTPEPFLEEEAETNPDEAGAAATGAVSPVEVNLSKITPESGSEEPQEAPVPGSPGGHNELVNKAKDDLARRLNVDVNAIETGQITSVEWRDGSLGCPAPGMMYTQALVPGYQITLVVAEKTYEYHTDQRRRIVLCQNGRPAQEGGPTR